MANKILNVKVTTERPKVKSRFDHDTAHLHPSTNVPTKLSSSYTLLFLRYSPDKILKLKVTMARSKVKSRSHHEVAHLHLLPISLSSVNFQHLTVSEIQPGQMFSCRPPIYSSFLYSFYYFFIYF